MKIYLLLLIALMLFVSNTINAKENKLDTDGFSKQEYLIVIPEGYVVFLYGTPAKPEEMPENKLEISLKKGDKIRANIVTKLRDIVDDCRKQTNKKAYKWIYTKDWLCVKVTSSASNSNLGKIGWLNKMYVEEYIY